MDSEDIYRAHGAVQPSLLDEFERKTQLRLPGKYRELILEHDAIRLVRDTFRFTNAFHNEHWPYRLLESDEDCRDVSFYGFGSDLPDYLQIERGQSVDVYGHDHVIAFGYAANGDYICFDYRHDPKTVEPYVVVMFHDAYDDRNKRLISHVANSFEEFMSLLYKSE